MSAMDAIKLKKKWFIPDARTDDSKWETNCFIEENGDSLEITIQVIKSNGAFRSTAKLDKELLIELLTQF